jgi:hypothetical protein
MALKAARKHFSEEQAKEFVSGYAMRLTDVIVLSHWNLVEKLAEELKDRKQLVSAELDYFLRRAHMESLKQLDFNQMFAEGKDEQERQREAK